MASATRVMVSIEPNECSNMVQALAKFNYNPGPEFLDEFLIRSAKKLRDMNTVELARTVMSLTKVGCVPTAEWGDAFWRATSDKVRGRRCVTQCEWMMSWQMPHCLPFPFSLTLIYSFPPSHAVPPQLRYMNDLDLGDLFMATASLAQAGIQPPQEWVDQVFG